MAMIHLRLVVVSGLLGALNGYIYLAAENAHWSNFAATVALAFAAGFCAANAVAACLSR